MRFDIITLFPRMVMEVLGTSILKRAHESGSIETHVHDLREFATDKHRTVDDTPYGGGAGMLLKVDVAVAALEHVKGLCETERSLTVMLTPQGERFTQDRAKSLASEYDRIILLCGHYEGFDERIRAYVDAEVSVGDYVVTGGELPALMIVDAVSRLVPGVITQESSEEESFSLKGKDGELLLEYPHYTRPFEFRGENVPDILLSGNHEAIRRWRLEEADKRTTRRSGQAH